MRGGGASEGAADVCLIHVQADMAGIARNVIRNKGAAFFRNRLIRKSCQIFQKYQVFRNIFKNLIGWMSEETRDNVMSRPYDTTEFR